MRDEYLPVAQAKADRAEKAYVEWGKELAADTLRNSSNLSSDQVDKLQKHGGLRNHV